MANHSQERSALCTARHLDASILGIARVAGETRDQFTAAYALRDEMPWQVQHWTDFFFQGVMALALSHLRRQFDRSRRTSTTEHVQYGAAFVFLVLVMLIALTSVACANAVGAAYHGKHGRHA